jgi:hypothetical protein
MILKMILGLVVVIALFLLVASFQPETFAISRSIMVSAAPQACFDQVNNFHNWEAWSPWAKLDPAMKTDYGGPASGEGASYSWDGAGKVGAGRMAITKSRPSQLIDIQLDFLRPMKTTNLTEFTFTPQGQETQVTWTMSGHKNLVAKAFDMIMNMDKLVGPDFEKGLAGIKSIAESGKK